MLFLCLLEQYVVWELGNFEILSLMSIEFLIFFSAVFPLMMLVYQGKIFRKKLFFYFLFN